MCELASSWGTRRNIIARRPQPPSLVLLLLPGLLLPRLLLTLLEVILATPLYLWQLFLLLTALLRNAPILPLPRRLIPQLENRHYTASTHLLPLGLNVKAPRVQEDMDSDSGSISTSGSHEVVVDGPNEESDKPSSEIAVKPEDDGGWQVQTSKRHCLSPSASSTDVAASPPSSPP